MELKKMEALADFTGHRYVIDMMNPEHWLRHYNEGTEVVNDFILPRGPRQQDEFSDTVYHAGTEVPYHSHAHGYETFEIARGSVDCVVNGKHFIAYAGDIIHLTPYTSHYFIFREEETIWRELFQEMDMSGGIFEKNIVRNHFSEFLKDDEFMVMYREGKTVRREPPVAFSEEPIDHTLVPECRTPDFALATYEGEGYSLKMKIGKWETGGCKEIWHADVKKGLTVSFKYPHTGYDLYYVKSGKLEVTIDKTYESAEPTTFIVGPDHIIDIPPYHTYTIKVLEDGDMYNYGGRHDLMACLEDLASVKKNDPERIATKESYLAFLRKYGVYATDIDYTSDAE